MQILSILPTVVLPTALALALPIEPVSPDSLENTFTVSNLQAWVGDTDNAHNNWVEFDSYASTDSSHYRCVVDALMPLYEKQIPCRKLNGAPKDYVWFVMSEDFNELTIKRLREVGGTYLSEIFTQGTYWNTENATATAIPNGKWYQRAEPWKFVVTSTHR
ncbi:hypothetical protein CC86DRAFT_432734 [Ophiobolus disseminans]|uniref:Uncharacterized protein n=1 Tax=Ophiobolus disseminans TaxID=1469910 RepID=A0A6A6ZDB1_9PLEO|nr:hypothetical protein CC86DRAFT_432734 [Ophiobolus disseminans]